MGKIVNYTFLKLLVHLHTLFSPFLCVVSCISDNHASQITTVRLWLVLLLVHIYTRMYLREGTFSIWPTGRVFYFNVSENKTQYISFSFQFERT